MWQTLFSIPHRIGPWTTFGFGWVLLGWCLFSLFTALRVARTQGVKQAVATLPFAAIVAAVIALLLPKFEVEHLTGDGQTHFGIAVRGYGVMLLIAVVSSVGLAVRRANRRGLATEWVLGLATWMLTLGIVGARLFYVAMYWHEYRDQGLAGMIGGLLNISQGGLVVYGSLVGGLIGFALFTRRHKLPALMIADIIAPCMLLGLAIGRIGCFLNGCCYGGPCEHPWAVRFPRQSVPYTEQLRDGSVHGFHWTVASSGDVVIDSVEQHSQLGQSGLQVGDVVRSINGNQVMREGADAAAVMAYLVESADTNLTLTTKNGRDFSSTLVSLPDRTTPLHPTQLYSALTATLLFLFLLAAEPYLSRTGQLFAMTITVYPIARFLLEIIRTDEGSFGSTGMTISQNISLLLLVAAVSLWVYLARQPVGKLQLIPSIKTSA